MRLLLACLALSACTATPTDPWLGDVDVTDRLEVVASGQDGLARPDLTSKEVVELENLREEANKAQMAVVAAGKLLQAYPE